MSPIIRRLGPGDASVLDDVAPDVFDNAIDPRRTAEFLADPRHHPAVAIINDQVVGMASAVHYVHPDKAPQLWINEVAVAPPYQGQEIHRGLLKALLELGCHEGRVGTGLGNATARRLYAAAGGVEDRERFVMVESDLRPEGEPSDGESFGSSL